MRLELTVRGAGRGGPGADLVVEAPAGTPLGAVLPDLAASAGLPGTTAAVVVDGVPVAASAQLGAPPLLRGAVLVLGSGDDAPPAATGAGGTAASTGAVGVVRVLSGPDAGLAAPVPLGRSWLGRGGGSALPLHDPAASRRHLELDRTPAGVRVRDAGSANGAVLDGRPLPRAWTALPAGALLQVGSGVLELVPVPRSPAGPGAAAVPDGCGGLVVHPSPTPAPTAPADVEVVVPPAPAPGRPAPVAWVAVLAPALVAVPLALLWSPVALLLAGTGPLVVLLTALVDRRRRRHEHRRALEDHRDAVRRARERAERALAAERAALELLHPGTGALLDVARDRGPLLWSRGAGERLEVRLGTARVPSGVVLLEPADGDEDHGEDDDGEGGGAAGAVRRRLEHGAGPLVVDLTGLHRVLVRGDPAATAAAARALVCQLAALHPPEHLELHLPAGAAAWRWARWLPHVPTAGTGASTGAPAPRRRVRVVDGADASSGADGVVVVLGGGGQVPAPRADAVLDVQAGGAATWSVTDRTTAVVVDLVTEGRAEDLARDLAPLRGPERAQRDAHAAAPPLTDLLALTDLPAGRGAPPAPDPLGPLDPRWVARGWDDPARSGAGTAVAVGVRPSGVPWVLDLDRDGPHALVAGTTGAGKSSFLLAWVLALAVAVPPEELSVVLVDYKGGATAGRLAGLPHLVGSVTDLDPHLAQRALTSLTAEVRRRERVLADHGAADRAELLRSRRDGARLLPRLLVVVDEVRVLADEVPDLVPGLVRLAAVGRSLGVHLVLATQRPAGAVSADARACTNLRVALRVRDAPDSLDVLDDPGAAQLPPDRPGAALVRRGGLGLEEVQVASLLRHPAVPVRVLAPGQEPPGCGDPVDEVPLLVASLRAAARGRRTAAGGAPWLPPLPDLLPWRHPRDVPAAGEDGDDDRAGRPGPGLPLGLLDEPEVPAQRLLRWGGLSPLAVCGGPGSGRTALVRWLAAASTREVHLVADPAEVGDVARLPHVASTVDPDDGEHLLRVLQHVGAAVRAARADPSGAPPLLLVDGADRVLAGRAGRGHRHEADAAADLLAGLVASGAPVVLACDAAALASRALAGVREALLLAPADRSAAVLAGVPSSAVPVRWPPGRALRLRPGPLRECQLPLLAPDRSEPTGPGSGSPPDPGARVPALPEQLCLVQLRERAGALPSSGGAPGQLAVGLGGLRAAPLGLDLGAGAGALVLGPPGSGRSSALRLLAAQATAGGRGCVLVRPRPPVPSLTAGERLGEQHEDGSARVPVVSGTDGGAARALLAALEPPSGAPGRSAPLVLVDDAELLLGSPLEALLLDLADGDGPACAVVAAGTSGLLPTHRGLAVALRRHRTGLLLHPLAPGDAEVLGARAPVVRSGPPGRASLVREGSLAVVQLALA